MTYPEPDRIAPTTDTNLHKFSNPHTITTTTNNTITTTPASSYYTRRLLRFSYSVSASFFGHNHSSRSRRRSQRLPDETGGPGQKWPIYLCSALLCFALLYGRLKAWGKGGCADTEESEAEAIGRLSWRGLSMRRSGKLCYNPELMILQLRNARSGAHVAIATSRSSTALFPLCSSSRSLAGWLARRSGSRPPALQRTCNTVCVAQGPGRAGTGMFSFLPGCLNGSGSRGSPDRGSAGQGIFFIPQSNGSKKVIR